MNNLKVAFQELLRPELFLEISTEGDLKVKEAEKDAVLKELLIKRVPQDSVAFELDHQPTGRLKQKLKNAFTQLSCLINGEHDKANKSCDFVIVTPGDQKTKIILGDLKSHSPRKTACYAQLRNSELFLKYLLRLLSEYHDQNIIAEFRKVVFHVPASINLKAPTQQKNQPKPKVQNDVMYFPVTIAGRNNAKSRISYQDFSK